MNLLTRVCLFMFGLSMIACALTIVAVGIGVVAIGDGELLEEAGVPFGISLAVYAIFVSPTLFLGTFCCAIAFDRFRRLEQNIANGTYHALWRHEDPGERQ